MKDRHTILNYHHYREQSSGSHIFYSSCFIFLQISDSSSEMKELLSHINSEVASCFKCLFMESLHPDCKYCSLNLCVIG